MTSSARVGLEHLRRAVNVVVPVALVFGLVLAACPRATLQGQLLAHHDRLVSHMREISLSQSWGMYAPDAARSHRYLSVVAHDADGRARELEESAAAEHGWGTVRGWTQSRRDIWRLEITRGFGRTNRNRVWYLRGVCAREARRGHEVERLELRIVSRGLRAPEQIQAGQDTLGPLRRSRTRTISCRVAIVQDMIAAAAGDSAPRR